MREEFRGLPRTIWWLAGGTFVNRLGDLVGTFLVIYLRRRGFDAGTSGAALTAYGAGSLVGGIVGGWAADRIGRRSTIVGSMVAGPLCLLLIVVARGAPSICAATCAFGLASNAYKPASLALLADVAAPQQLPAATAAYRLAVNAGYAAGGLAGGFAFVTGRNAIVLGDAGTSLAFAMVAAITLPSHVARGNNHVARGRRRGPVPPRTVVFLGGALAVWYLIAAFPVALPLHFAAEGIPPSVFGAIISLNAVLVMIAEPYLTIALRNRPVHLVLTAGALLLGVGLAASTLVTGIAVLLALVFVWTTGEMLFVPFASIFISRSAPPAARGWYQGVYAAVKGGASTIAPIVAALTFSSGLLATSAAMLIAALVATTCFAAARPSRS